MSEDSQTCTRLPARLAAAGTVRVGSERRRLRPRRPPHHTRHDAHDASAEFKRARLKHEARQPSLAYGTQHTHNHLLPQNSSWAKKRNVATAVTSTAKGEYICNCVARLDDDDETGCAAL